MAELPEGLEFTLTNLQHMQEVEILLCACGRDRKECGMYTIQL